MNTNDFELSSIGVSYNGGTPKWMVDFMENPVKIDDLGVPPILGNLHIIILISS